jgi:hypothetical protein
LTKVALARGEQREGRAERVQSGRLAQQARSLAEASLAEPGYARTAQLLHPYRREGVQPHGRFHVFGGDVRLFDRDTQSPILQPGVGEVRVECDGAIDQGDVAGPVFAGNHKRHGGVRQDKGVGPSRVQPPVGEFDRQAAMPLWIPTPHGPAAMAKCGRGQSWPIVRIKGDSLIQRLDRDGVFCRSDAMVFRPNYRSDVATPRSEVTSIARL